MNGRTVFAVNRSPVLAWNVEPTPLPYADMPAAAAAAISPAADPYARCWQNQVEPGTGFSYLGALYNNSLPPTAYRLQPGCMANLSQFWPPTPPPDGCGRYDGSNLYIGPHVYRHSESIPSNLRNSYQNLGHYSHVVEASKDSNQRTFKRETPVSPNVNTSSIGSSVSNSESFNSHCVIDSKLKPHVSMSSTLPKQEIMPASSSNHEPYFCGPESRSSSSLHPSNDKACFSPPYSLKNTLSFQNHPQDISAHKFKALNTTQENNCNASPLKNVYFSNIESENVNSMLNKKFKSSENHYQRFDPKTVSIDINKSRNSTNFLLHNPYASKKYDVPVSSECCNVNSNCKLRTDKQPSDCIMVADEHQYKQKNNVSRVKPEKSSHSDCKYQRTVKNTTNMHVPEYRTSSEMFNIPTSVVHSKLESNDKYFLSNCSSTVPSCISNSYANSGTYLLSKDFPQAYHHGMVYPNSCSLSKPWHVPELPVMNSDPYFKAPEASKPPMVPRPSFASPATMHEEPVSVAQTAPQDINSVHVTSRKQLQPKVFKGKVEDDDVQIISVKSPLPITSKSISRTAIESKSSLPPSVPEITPLCLKSEVESEKPDTNKILLDTKIESNAQWIKTEPVPPVLEKEVPIPNISSSAENKNESFEPDFAATEPPKINCEVVAIKQEVTQKETSEKCDILDTVNKTSDYDQILISSEVTDDSSNTSNMPELQKELQENVPVSDFADTNHNLNLLLNTIEKVTSLENSSRSDTPVSVKSELIENETKTLDKKSESPKPCGLDLLSVIAGQRLESEFVVIKDDIKSNYPLIMNKDKEISEDTKPKLHSICSLQKASVFEMQAKLAELQKKYKQKQKEVSRLKPKKRFTSMFLNGQKKSGDEQDASSGSNMDLTDLNGSTCSTSADDSLALEDHEKDCVKKASITKTNSIQESQGMNKKTQKRRASSEACSSEPTEKQIRTRSSSRHSAKTGASDGYCSSPSEHTHKTAKSTGHQLRKMKASSLCNSVDDDIQIIGITENSSDKLRHMPRRKYLCDNKKMESYSLRHSSQMNKGEESTNPSSESAVCLKNLTSKRKSDNPKKYMPSKQGKLSETIIAKQLRNRILFDTSGSISDDDNAKDGGMVEELYDALMKCNLEDGSKKDEKSYLSSSPLGSPDPRRLKPEDLAVKQRLLTLDDGIFYPGSIKEVQANDRYGIMLDERRGNRLQSFTKEELLTLAIVESKPLSSELPEGTRVCAFWNEYYGCMYPGTVKKAPCPSADWSEPRVYVIFDDGDFGHYVLKNIRLIPPDIIPFKNDVNTENTNPAELQNSLDVSCGLGERPPRLQCSTPKTSSVKDCDTSNENESKDSSCASINDSSCDDSCFIEYTLSPSHNQLKTENNSASCSFSNDTTTDTSKLEKRQKKHSKRKISSRTKLKEDSPRDKSESKTKRHKKYKDKHRKHHRHHRYHHRHHHHHHHHSKKHKHKKKIDKTPPFSQDLDKATFIPCSHKASFKGIQLKDAVVRTNHVEHSGTANLPQNENNTTLLE